MSLSTLLGIKEKPLPNELVTRVESIKDLCFSAGISELSPDAPVTKLDVYMDLGDPADPLYLGTVRADGFHESQRMDYKVLNMMDTIMDKKIREKVEEVKAAVYTNSILKNRVINK